MSTSTIYVSNISAETHEKELKDFLSFCGKISELKLEQDGTHQKATVVFEKASAAKTALLLDNTLLKSNEIHVTAAGESTAADHTTERHEGDEIRQEDKPRTRVFAEYLAHGYKLGDNVLQRAIEVDNQHGISSKFLNTLQNLDQRTQASTRAAELDTKYKVSEQARQGGQSAWWGISSYFEKFSHTGPGQKVVAFYSSSEKQVKDIHQEALRLSGLKEKYQASSTTDDGSSKKFVPEPVAGGTKCGCGGEDQVCGCAAGSCKCASCPKSDSPTKDTQTATGQATDIASTSNVAPLGEKK